MGYQALLFCPDQKLARIVTQVFSELDFTVEPVNEPFAAVKKLMAQRYDAIVVDCESEANAALLFKSARNSSSNQNSLALALVEGQTGVAKAYRIGANLVLTKPINVEQAKGTLRVARGLLRKNLDAASTGSPASALPARPASATPVPAFKPSSQSVEPPAPGPSFYEAPEFDTALPEIPPPTQSPRATPAFAAHTETIAGGGAPGKLTRPGPTFEDARPAAHLSSLPAPNPSTVHASPSGAAAAPAPAKEAPAPAEKTLVAAHPVEPREINVPTFGMAPGSSPSFGALDDDEDASGSGGSKKFLIAAAVILVVAGLAYIGWSKMSKPSAATPATSPITSSAPVGTSAIDSSAATSETSSSISQPVTTPGGKPSASIASPPANKISGESEPVLEPRKSEHAPIVVRSSPSGNKTTAQGEEPAPAPPLAMATPNDKNLSGLVSAGPVPLPKVAPSSVKISQGVSQGLLIKRVQPRYPQGALQMRVQGAVQMEAVINKEGNISNLKVVSGDQMLARAAAEAVRQWRYKPYYLNGEPVEIETQITVNFKLPN